MPPNIKSKRKSRRSKTSRPTVAVQVTSSPIIETMIKLGSIVTDTATGMDGMVTHLQIEMNRARFYLFQPRGISPKDGSPVRGMWVAPIRLSGGEIIPTPALPLEVLGTRVEDRASGFNGIAVSLALHISGCVHVSVQPQGRFEKTGGAVAVHDFDIRRLSGPAIVSMTDAERDASQKENPSPGEVTSYSPALPAI